MSEYAAWENEFLGAAGMLYTTGGTKDFSAALENFKRMYRQGSALFEHGADHCVPDRDRLRVLLNAMIREADVLSATDSDSRRSIKGE